MFKTIKNNLFQAQVWEAIDKIATNAYMKDGQMVPKNDPLIIYFRPILSASISLIIDIFTKDIEYANRYPPRRDSISKGNITYLVRILAIYLLQTNFMKIEDIEQFSIAKFSSILDISPIELKDQLKLYLDKDDPQKTVHFVREFNKVIGLDNNNPVELILIPELFINRVKFFQQNKN